MAEGLQIGLPAGTRVLVTAGAAGIGRAIVERFLAAGAKVHLCDIDEAALASCLEALPEAGGTLADVGDPAQVDRLFEAADEKLGGLDVLVNNAGIAGPTSPVEDISTEDWDRTLSVNINGQFYCARRAVPRLKAAGGGAIVNLSSVAGRLGFPLRTPYSASKWAVVGFTESLAMELGPDNIRVNAIQPGMVAGERIERVIANKAAALAISHEAFRERLVSAISLRRAVSAENIADMVLFLCSEAGSNISGQAISVCGNVESLK
jgi:NAD(P)-dependent dehydrogenase (short-subunit alcohol dehydrogenase family)